MLSRLLLFFACNVCHGYTYYQSFQPVASPSDKTASIYQLQSVPFAQSCAAALSVGDAPFLLHFSDKSLFHSCFFITNKIVLKKQKVKIQFFFRLNFVDFFEYRSLIDASTDK